jgi:mono/diheme cytochrome c family protein
MMLPVASAPTLARELLAFDASKRRCPRPAAAVGVEIHLRPVAVSRVVRLRSLAALSLVALAFVGAGCGGGDDGEDAEPPTAATTSGETAAGEASGEQVFAENCGGCHTLAAAGTSGTTGPNLDSLMPDSATVEEQVRNGGGGMPAFEGELSDAEIAAVAEYVSSSAGS